MTIGAFSIIRNEQNHVLLCLRADKDMWNLPGGRLEAGESPWDTAVREVYEEIGVVVKLDMLVGVYYKPTQDDLVFQFIGSIQEGVPTLSAEVRVVRFFDAGALPNNMAPLQRDRILRFYQDPTRMQWDTQ